MFTPEMLASVKKVEATRQERLGMEPRRMTAEEKDALLKAYHPDYREDGFDTIKIGPNKGEKVPKELGHLLHSNSRLLHHPIDLTKIDYDTDVLVIGSGIAGAVTASSCTEHGLKVLLVEKAEAPRNIGLDYGLVNPSIMAEKDMDRGNFDKALEYYQKAQAEAKDPAALDATIQLIKDYQSAEDYVGNGQYTEAIAALKQLQNRVTDPDSAMYKAIEDLLDKAQSAQSDDQFNSDLDEAQSYLDDKKYDAASGKLDSLANDDSLTDDQKKQVKELQKQLSDAQQQEKQQEENSQKKAEQRDAFSKKMDELESDDLKISSAENQEDELAMTASSFEQWDNLLSEMYDYLATVLNADQYASEEASYKQWVQERDSGAENAAKETEDDTAKQLASYSFKQSYTKTHCYKLLDLMN